MTAHALTRAPEMERVGLDAHLRDHFDGFAWAVGIIEGEGCIREARPDAQHTYARITVQMTDQDVVRRLFETLGCGTIRGPRAHPGTNRQDTWEWDVSGAAAARLLRRMLPYLGERRRSRSIACLTECGELRNDQLVLDGEVA